MNDLTYNERCKRIYKRYVSVDPRMRKTIVQDQYYYTLQICYEDNSTSYDFSFCKYVVLNCWEHFERLYAR